MTSAPTEHRKKVLTMAEYFAGGHLRFVNGEWRDDNGNAIEISRVRHGRWECGKPCPVCGEDRFKGLDADIWADWEPHYCPNCGAKMDVGDGNSDNVQKLRQDVNINSML